MCNLEKFLEERNFILRAVGWNSGLDEISEFLYTCQWVLQYWNYSFINKILIDFDFDSKYDKNIRQWNKKKIYLTQLGPVVGSCQVRLNQQGL